MKKKIVIDQNFLTILLMRLTLNRSPCVKIFLVTEMKLISSEHFCVAQFIMPKRKL